MSTENTSYVLSEPELVVLTTFFLALPLPPVFIGTSQQDVSVETVLGDAVDSLKSKGWLHVSGNNVDVDPNLVALLRTMAYSEQMTFIFWQRQGEPLQQIAYYPGENFVVEQQILPEGEHRLALAQGKDFGKNLVMTLLDDDEGGEGQTRLTVQIRKDGWDDLLASRLAGNTEELRKALVAEAQDDKSLADRLRFADDTLNARLVIGIDCVYNRLDNQKEHVVFVLATTNNWLLSNSATEGWMQAVSVPRVALRQATAAIFAPLQSDVKQ